MGVKKSAVIVQGEANLILLCKSEREIYFGFPGGHIEKGESADKAAAREVLEETGYEIEIVKSLPPFQHHSVRDSSDADVAMFFAKAKERSATGSDQVEWKNLDEAKAIIYPALAEYLNVNRHLLSS